MKLTLIATSTFGLESIVAKELEKLGYDELKVENGKVTFQGNERDIAICNLWLRTADRVLIKIAEFKAESFEELFEGTKNANWGEIIPETGNMHVEGKSIKSKLFSVPDCQSIVKKAVIESMKTKYKKDWFQENGTEYRIEVAILKDIVTLTIDTSGKGLHKRGYRNLAGEAPLKETLAAALILISKWNPSRILADPLCGSGTIPIEAALIGKNIAPGLNRSFVSENFDIINPEIWNSERQRAKSLINNEEFRILASDEDGDILRIAKENAVKAGVSDYISFQKLSVQQFSSKRKYGCIICNPPYGERIGDKKEIERLYKDMGRVFSELENWSFFILTSYLNFEKFYGTKSTRNRKLYNGRIQCYYYQYFGKLPSKKDDEEIE